MPAVDRPTDPLPPDLFVALLQPVLPHAHRMALHLAGERADAEDLVQESAMRAYRHFAHFRAGSNFRAWFLRIVANSYYSMRRRRPWPVRTGRLVDAVDVESLAVAGGPDPASTFEAHQHRELVAAALARLPGEYRAVCTLYLIHDLRYADIAARLGIPVGTVRSRLHRGRQLLRRALRPVALDWGYAGALDAVPDADAASPAVREPVSGRFTLELTAP